MPNRYAPRNPADVLGLGRDPALCRLLRACGADEACLSGKASDYDKFVALAAALPLCEGHPIRVQVESALREVTGLQAPLCPHTARVFWEIWTEIHWYGKDVDLPTLPAVCPLCPPVEPVALRMSDLIPLTDPVAVKAPDLIAWSQVLEDALPHNGRSAVLSIPDDYVFIRPNPYHTNLAVQKASRGEALAMQERDLLITQALRVWGLAWNKSAKILSEPNALPALILHGGSSEAVIALIGYLDAAKALLPMVWIPHDPTHAKGVSGRYASVWTGYAITSLDAPEVMKEARTAYAAVAPIGRSIQLIE